MSKESFCSTVLKNQIGKFHVGFYALATEWVTDTSDCQNVNTFKDFQKKWNGVTASLVSRETDNLKI